jgi:DnaJ-class molecular chaperone
VLSDPKKKELYDSGQMEYDGDPGAGMGGMGGGFHGGSNIDPQDIFKMFFGGGGMGGDEGFGSSFGGMSGMGGMGGRGGRGGKNGNFTFKFG